jgi:hypothetical protein
MNTKFWSENLTGGDNFEANIRIDVVCGGLCHHGMSQPRVADGGDGLQICSVSANISNKQSRTTDKVWSSSMGAGRGDTNSSP